MFQDVTLKPLLTEESYTLHGKEAQHFFINKLYTAARRGDKFRELVQDVFENVAALDHLRRLGCCAEGYALFTHVNRALVCGVRDGGRGGQRGFPFSHSGLAAK